MMACVAGSSVDSGTGSVASVIEDCTTGFVFRVPLFALLAISSLSGVHPPITARISSKIRWVRLFIRFIWFFGISELGYLVLATSNWRIGFIEQAEPIQPLDNSNHTKNSKHFDTKIEGSSFIVKQYSWHVSETTSHGTT